jgi:acyl-CoA reductase-like NAD-dependent aldehyde dehydrogenase
MTSSPFAGARPTKGAVMAKAKVSELGQPALLRSFSPVTGDVIAEVPPATPEAVRDAVARARAAQPAWAALGPPGRARALAQVRHRVHERMDEIVRTVATETGKPEAEALSHDVVPSLLTMAYLERLAPRALRPRRVGRLVAPLVGFNSTIEWRPYGVVGCISPWNYPVYLSFIAIVPALLAGNTVVLKPSEFTPGSGEAVRDALSVLPEGVATVVQGAGDVGAALIDAPCDKICFIGSAATARKIIPASASHLTPMVMELGGQDAAIVCDDANLDVASSGILWGGLLNAGQTCCAIERVYVVESVADRFEEQLVSKLEEVLRRPDAQIGPLCINRQLETVERQVEDAVEHGAKVLTGGPAKATAGSNGRLWYPPTVIEGRSEQMAIFSEETFGPVLPIVRVKDEEEALRRTNDEGFNLTASVWTRDVKRGRAIASRMRAGAVSVNDHAANAGATWALWGGVGESGYGRLQGELGLREFAVPVHVGVSTLPGLKKLWWYPYDKETNQALRSIADLLGAQGLPTKLRALASIGSNAIRAMRRKI